MILQNGCYYWVRFYGESKPVIMEYDIEAYTKPIWWATGTEQPYDTNRVKAIQGPIEYTAE